MKYFQSTLKKQISFSGYGVHNGKPSKVVLIPADINHGIVFLIYDKDYKPYYFLANVSHVFCTKYCITLGSKKNYVKMIEHLMAAISASEIDNLLIEVLSSELPILDGGSETYIQKILKVGIKKQKAPRRYIRILKSIKVECNASTASFEPSDSTKFDISISFSSKSIGYQHIAFSLNMDFFKKKISSSRTFGFLKDVEMLWSKGFARGSSLKNSIVIDDDKILNVGGLNSDDEFVCHKALDAIGDTSLLGKPFIGVFRSFKGSHRLNILAVRSLIKNSKCYEIIEMNS